MTPSNWVTTRRGGFAADGSRLPWTCPPGEHGHVVVGRTEDAVFTNPDGSMVTYLANGLTMEERTECNTLEANHATLTPAQAGRLLALYKILAAFQKKKRR